MPTTIDEVIVLFDRHAKGEITLPEAVTERCLEIQNSEIEKQNNPDVETFIQWLNWVESAGVTPHLVPLKRHDKSPDTSRGKILNEDKTAVNEPYRLTRETAIEWMKAGNNVGCYGTPDTLLFLDIDIDRGRTVYPDEKVQQLIDQQDTFTDLTRTGGYQLTYLSDGSTGNPHHYFNNVDAGEVRREWQYVVCPGSFVPKNKKFKANDMKGYTKNATGYYSVVRNAPIKKFDPSTLPEWVTLGQIQPKPLLGTCRIPTPAQTPHHTEYENQFGRTLKQIRLENYRLDTALNGPGEGEDRSKVDFLVCIDLLRNHFEITQIGSILSKYRPYEKTERPDYIQNTVLKAYDEYKKTLLKDGYVIRLTGRSLADKSDNALAALISYNKYPTLFMRGGELVKVNHTEKTVPRIGSVDEHYIRHVLSRCARFIDVKKKKVGDEEKTIVVTCDPPLSLSQDIFQHTRLSEYIPGLRGITCMPIIHPDGSIFSVPGYDVETQNYYAPVAIDALDVPDKPTDDDVKDAVALLEEVIADFPFYDDDTMTGASKANTLGMIITTAARSIIPGKIPAHLITKPARGTGASFLCAVLYTIATGINGAFHTAPTKEEDWKKDITTMISGGSTLNVFDNVEGEISSQYFSAVLTMDIWKDRKFHSNSEELCYESKGILWVVNGNNVEISGDVGRRSVLIQLDAKTARPFERTSLFAHGRDDEFITWLLENRGRVISAIMTLIRSWILKGEPEPENPRIIGGGFESWSRIIGGILGNAGIENFLGNLDYLYDKVDVGTEEWSAFITTWYEQLKDKPHTAREIADLMKTLSTENPYDYKKGSALLDTLPTELFDSYNHKNDSFAKVLGRAIRKKQEVRFDVDGITYYFTTGKSVNRSIQWKVCIEPTQN